MDWGGCDIRPQSMSNSGSYSNIMFSNVCPQMKQFIKNNSKVFFKITTVRYPIYCIFGVVSFL